MTASPDPHVGMRSELRVSATPEMIAAAWGAWHVRHGGKLGPCPAFVEAINAALAVCPGRLAGLREAAEVIVSQIQPPHTGTRSDDFMLGWAAGANDTAERNHAAILALAEGRDG